MTADQGLDGSARPRYAYLGPEGTFTHAAALTWADDASPVPLAAVEEVYRAVGTGEVDRGVVAIESSVEGYVVPSLDALVAADDVVEIRPVISGGSA